MAGVLTVASTSDWNVSTGGNCASRPSPPARVDALLQVARDRRRSGAPALAGNELYLNGLYSGTTSSQRAFSK